MVAAKSMEEKRIEKRLFKKEFPIGGGGKPGERRVRKAGSMSFFQSYVRGGKKNHSQHYLPLF